MTTIIFLNEINYYIKASYYTCTIIQSLTTVLNCQKGVVMYGKGIFIFSDINNISEHVLLRALNFEMYLGWKIKPSCKQNNVTMMIGSNLLVNL